MAERPADRPVQRSVTSPASDSTDTVKSPIIPPPPPPKEPRKPLAQRIQEALGTGAEVKAEPVSDRPSARDGDGRPERSRHEPAPAPAERRPAPQAAPQVERRPVSAVPTPAPAHPQATPAPTPVEAPIPTPVETPTEVRRPLQPAREARTPEAKQPRPVKAPATPSSGRRPRRARLRLTRIDPWSVMKTAFLLSIALGIVTVVSVFMVWSILTAAGVWDSINATVASVLGGEDGGGFNVQDYVGMNRVMGFTILVSIIDVILLTAIATLAAFLYNLAAALLGGIEVTLAED